jgi:GNAT superfamily N-acetyltransferase
MDVHRDAFLISDDPWRLDLDAICDMLSRAYWAQGRSKEKIMRTLEHSLCFGVYHADRQVGLARVITDYTTFAWLCDVFIHEDFRGQGLGRWLVETALNHPELRGIRRWMLATRDAHGLYQQFGFSPMKNPDRWMEIFNG